jgi:glycosyltransferase involved in cell wall biosynthesis
MVYVLKQYKKNKKGIIIFNVDEKDFFKRKYIKFLYKKKLDLLKKKYFFLMHWSWYGFREKDIPYIDYHLAGSSTLSFENKNNNRIVDFCNRNFIDKIFQIKKTEKIYDVISIIRPVHWKNLKELFKAANQLYKKKLFYKFLIIFPMPSDKTFYSNRNTYYTKLIDDYNLYIHDKYKKYFTLIPINTFDYKYTLHKEQICNFLNLSKIFILPVRKEGASRVIHEALLCGLPVIYYKYLKGGGKDFLDKTNSVYYSTESQIYKKIIYSLKNYKRFKLNKININEKMSETFQVPRFKKFLKKLYDEDNHNFDTKIDLTELDRKLDSHKITLEKKLRKPITNHIKNFSSFYRFISILLREKPSIIKIIFITIQENIFYFMRYLKYNILLKIKYFFK